MPSFESLNETLNNPTGRTETARRANEIGLLAIIVFVLAMIAGCGGKPFNVKERPFKVRENANMPPPDFDAKAATASVTVQAEAVIDEDFLYETFDANLILAGVLPIGVMITNTGQEPLLLNKARFEVRAQGGRSFKSADAKRAFKRLISYYGISTYSKPGYKKSQEDFAAYSLDTSNPLGPGESREGMLFFLVPGEVARGAGLNLVVSRLDRRQSDDDEALELKLR
jgi:hypothetical protein